VLEVKVLTDCVIFLTSFTTPHQVGQGPASLLWLFPLTMSICIVYKTTKIPKITAPSFLKEVAILFLSIVLVLILIAVLLYVMAWLVTE